MSGPSAELFMQGRLSSARLSRRCGLSEGRAADSCLCNVYWEVKRDKMRGGTLLTGPARLRVFFRCGIIAAKRMVYRVDLRYPTAPRKTFPFRRPDSCERFSPACWHVLSS